MSIARPFAHSKWRMSVLAGPPKWLGRSCFYFGWIEGSARAAKGFAWWQLHSLRQRAPWHRACLMPLAHICGLQVENLNRFTSVQKTWVNIRTVFWQISDKIKKSQYEAEWLICVYKITCSEIKILIIASACSFVWCDFNNNKCVYVPIL